jgi:hypothetical protein
MSLNEETVLFLMTITLEELLLKVIRYLVLMIILKMIVVDNI